MPYLVRTIVRHLGIESLYVRLSRRTGADEFPVWFVGLVVLWAVLVLLAGVMAVERALDGNGDFEGFYTALEPLALHGELADAKSVERYPPTFQTLHLPFMTLPLSVAASLWTLLNIAACVWIPFAFRSLSGVTVRGQAPAWAVMAPFILDNLLLGQSGLILLAAVTTALALAKRGAGWGAGGLLGLATAFKVMPILFMAVPMSLVRCWRAILGAGVVVLALVVGTMAWFGPGETVTGLRAWVVEVRTEHTPHRMVEDGRSLRYNNQGLVITLMRTLTALPPEVELEGPVLAHWPRPAVAALGVAIAAGALLAWLALMLKLRRRQDGAAWLGLFAAAAIVMLAVAPLVWTHYFIWLAPALILLHRHVKWLIGLAVVSAGCLAVKEARFLGVHMWLTLALLPLIVLHLRGGGTTGDTVPDHGESELPDHTAGLGSDSSVPEAVH